MDNQETETLTPEAVADGAEPVIPEGAAPEGSLREALESAVEQDAEKQAAEEAEADPNAAAEAAEAQKAAVEAAKAKAEKGEELSEEEKSLVEQSSAQAPEDMIAPEHWAKEHQEMFQKLDPQAKQFLMERNKEMEAAHTRRSQEIAPIRQAMERWSPYTQQIGTTPEIMFERLMQAENILRVGTPEQKYGALMSLAQEYGVQVQTAQEQLPPVEEDPLGIQQQIQNALGPLAQQVQQMQYGFQSQGQQEFEARNAQAVQEIGAFREEKDEQGNLKHPHFQEVYDDMIQLAQAQAANGVQVSLPELYDKAIWANPAVREKVRTAEKNRAEIESRKAAQEAAAKAKKANGSLTGGGNGTAAEQPRSLRQELEYQFQQHA